MSALPDLPNAGEVSRLLAGHIEALVRQTLPQGRRDGHEWRVGSTAGEPGRSLGVHLAGERAGVWADFASGDGGDALDLVAAVLCGDDRKEAYWWALDWLGIRTAAPEVRERARDNAARAQKQAEQAERQRAAARGKKVAAVWQEAREGLAGTPSYGYLLGRGIDLRRLGRQPRCLRHHPALYEPETRDTWPALVAAVADGRGRLVAVHRHYLAVTAEGVSKAPVQVAKRSLGAVKGGCIRLWRGAAGTPLKDAAPGERVVITEGVEDGLSIALARPEARVLVAVSLSNMAAVALPEGLDVVIAADNDATGSQAEKALDRALMAHRRHARRVRLARPPADVKDFNELLVRGDA